MEKKRVKYFLFYQGNDYISWLLYLDAVQTACSLSIRTALLLIISTFESFDQLQHRATVSSKEMTMSDNTY